MKKTFFEKINENENVTIDFLGDSITLGTIHCQKEEAYVAKFADYLASEIGTHTIYRYDGIPIAGSAEPMKCFEGPVLCAVGKGEGKIDIIKNGIGGSTVLKTTERPQDFLGELPNGARHDIAFLMYGINDALVYDKGKFVSGEQFKKNCKKLIDMLIEDNPDVTIVLTPATTPTILSYEKYPKYVTEEEGEKEYSIEDHVEAMKELASEEGYALIDTHALWQNHKKEGEIRHGHGNWLVGNDSCHPSPIASDVMAKFVCDEFIRLAKLGKI